jgi:hypothetical protein
MGGKPSKPKTWTPESIRRLNGMYDLRDIVEKKGKEEKRKQKDTTGSMSNLFEGSDTEDDGGSMLSDSFNGLRTGLRDVLIVDPNNNNRL